MCGGPSYQPSSLGGGASIFYALAGKRGRKERLGPATEEEEEEEESRGRTRSAASKAGGFE